MIRGGCEFSSHDHDKWGLQATCAALNYRSPKRQLLRYSHHHQQQQLLQQGSSVALAAAATCEALDGGSGDYQVSANETIISPQSVYQVLELLGRGTFGQVLRCWKKDTNEVIAMKILKNLPSYTKQGQVEVDVLTILSKVDSEKFNFVHAYESFAHHGHICIVFECLQINLYDYLKQNRFQPLPLKHIRPVAQQVLTCLKKLRQLGLVHADLKPENIMLVDPDRHPFKVKVIDFGSATCCSSALSTTYLQSRYYRAPEVLLGMAYDESIDMWSLGCVLAEMFLGWPLFPGATEYDQISYISQMLGSDPPNSLTKNAVKMCKFYRRDNQRKWVLKTPAQFQVETGICLKEARKFIFTSVAAIGGRHNAASAQDPAAVAQQQDRVQFVALLEMLLTFDPKRRADPSSCLQHPFITMLHLSMQTTCPCVREWIECMQVCCQTPLTTSSPPLLPLTTTSPPHTPPAASTLLPTYPHLPLTTSSLPRPRPAASTLLPTYPHLPLTTSSLPRPPPAASTLLPTYPHLLYTLDPAYLSGHTHTAAVVPVPSHWVSSRDYQNSAVAAHSSSVLVDTGYVSADSSPINSTHTLVDCPQQVELTPQTYSSPFLVPPHSAYWLMLQQSGYLVNHSRL